MAAKIIREGDGIWIAEVPPFSESGRPVCTFAGSMAAVLAHSSHPLGVEDILGLSGYAFHTRWCHSNGEPTGCPGSVSLEQGFLLDALSEHSGWRFRMLFDQGWDKAKMQRGVPAILASIDAGTPVIIEDRYIDAAVLYGYINHGERFLLNSYREGYIEAALADLSQDPAYAILLEAHVEPPPFVDVFCDVLDKAITWWHREHEPDTCGGPYMRIGRTALKSWAEFYGTVDELASIYPRGKGGLLYNSLMNFQHLFENRQAAAGFLSRHANRFPEATDIIQAAADTYAEEVEVLATVVDPADGFWSAFNQVRSALVSRSRASIPWEEARSVEQTGVWTPEVQRRERRIMEEALMLEETAIQHLAQARAKICH